MAVAAITTVPVKCWQPTSPWIVWSILITSASVGSFAIIGGTFVFAILFLDILDSSLSQNGGKAEVGATRRVLDFVQITCTLAAQMVDDTHSEVLRGQSAL
jgi:hypothetical protein